MKFLLGVLILIGLIAAAGIAISHYGKISLKRAFIYSGIIISIVAYFWIKGVAEDSHTGSFSYWTNLISIYICILGIIWGIISAAIKLVSRCDRKNKP